MRVHKISEKNSMLRCQQPKNPEKKNLRREEEVGGVRREEGVGRREERAMKQRLQTKTK